MSCPNVSVKKAPYQQGVALITVLVIVALIAIIAAQITASMLLQERRSANLLQTDQAYQYALGAESLAAAKLQDALKGDSEKIHAGQLWNQQFTFPIEDGGGVLQARLSDLSACFNVNALLYTIKKSGGNKTEEQAGDNNNPTEKNMTTGERLYLHLLEQVVPDAEAGPATLVATLRDWVDEDSDTSGSDGAEDYEYMGYEIPYRTGNGALGALSELRTIKGYDAKVYQKLKPYLCALPDQEYLHINVNTVTPEHAELVSIMVENLPVETAKSMLQNRPKDGWTKETFWATSSGLPTDAKEWEWAQGGVVFTTSYFKVQAEAIVGRGRARVESTLKANDDKTWSVQSRAFAED